MVGSLVFLTPLGALAALALLLPLAGLALAARREAAARRLLRLPAPPPAKRLPRLLALAAVPVVLGVAATQPALRSRTTTRVRTDAQAFFVIDISRSMMASRSPSARTRLARAKAEALRIRDAIAQVPSGIATLTDRALPSLFPNPDSSVFANTLRNAVLIENPGPTTSNVLATSLDAIGALGNQNYFAPAIRRRLVVVLTDGESTAVHPRADAQALAAGPGVKLILVHVWSPDERVYDPSGKPEEGYHPHLDSTALLSELAQAAGGHVFGENAVGSAERAARAALGNGPTRVLGRSERTQTLAPYVALAALLPLLLLLRGTVRRGLARELRDLVAERLWAPVTVTRWRLPVQAGARGTRAP